jgi:hypothetical protein
MTERFYEFLKSTAAADMAMLQMFIFALVAVITFPVLDWTPAWMRRTAQVIYLVAMLIVFLFTVYFGNM